LRETLLANSNLAPPKVGESEVGFAAV
jgi:hypothetical protein